MKFQLFVEGVQSQLLFARMEIITSISIFFLVINKLWNRVQQVTILGIKMICNFVLNLVAHEMFVSKFPNHSQSLSALVYVFY